MSVQDSLLRKSHFVCVIGATCLHAALLALEKLAENDVSCRELGTALASPQEAKLTVSSGANIEGDEGNDAEGLKDSMAYCRLLVKLLLDDDDDVRYCANHVVSKAGRYQVCCLLPLP